jgi:hypothetical protein
MSQTPRNRAATGKHKLWPGSRQSGAAFSLYAAPPLIRDSSSRDGEFAYSVGAISIGPGITCGVAGSIICA